jgi:post-segregation antitoxin (ccd killing protein)
MKTMKRRATVYLRPELHKALRVKSIDTDKSVSDLINEAIRVSLREDAEDLAAFRERAKEPTVDFEQFLKELNARGQL